jgi:hypothetical protein
LQLSTLDRLLLLAALPEKGSFTTLRIVRGLREDLSFSEEEHAALNFTEDGDMVRWEPGAAIVKDFEFGKKALDCIEQALKTKSEGGEADEQLLALWEKFDFDKGDGVS